MKFTSGLLFLLFYLLFFPPRQAEELAALAATSSSSLAANPTTPPPEGTQLKLMQLDSQETERRLAEHELRARREWELSYAEQQRLEQQRLQAMTAQNDQELEQSLAADRALLQAEAAAAEERMRRWQQHALNEQSRNPLGLHYGPALAANGHSAAQYMSPAAAASDRFQGSPAPSSLTAALMAASEPQLPPYPLASLSALDRTHSSGSLSPSSISSSAQPSAPPLSRSVTSWPAPEPRLPRPDMKITGGYMGAAAPDAGSMPPPPAYSDEPMPKAAAAAAARDAASAQPSRGAAEKAAFAAAAMQGPPPPYAVASGSEKARAHSDLFQAKAPLQEAGYVPANAERVETAPRCASCYDPIGPGLVSGRCGRAVRGPAGIYHLECWQSSAGPRCSHCAQTLFAHPEEGLSGGWGEYRGKRYHVECYQYFAGPRCCMCFDVVFADIARGFSGQWRSLADGSFIHEECYQRRGSDPSADRRLFKH